MPIDHAGFLVIKEEGVLNDVSNHDVSFETSGAYLSFNIKELRDKYDAKFILLISDPDKVVNSYIQKGWYAKKTFVMM